MQNPLAELLDALFSSQTKPEIERCLMTKNQVWVLMFLIAGLFSMSIGGCWHIEHEKMKAELLRSHLYDDRASRLADNMERLVELQQKVISTAP